MVIRVAKEQRGNNSSLVVSVTDNGVGMAQNEVDQIFDRFYQAENGDGTRQHGSGIGLALTSELVTLMGGTITAESEVGRGTVFTVNIPITQNAQMVTTRPPAPATGEHLLPGTIAVPIEDTWTNEDHELPLVLIIEDNADVVYYLRTCLEDNYQILHAANGALGIEKAFEIIPDLVICDVSMPEKNGFEVCATLKQDERTNHIPIIMLTARVALEDRLTGLEQGADAYLAKPFEKDELLIRLRQLLDLRKKLHAKYSAQLLDHPEPTITEPENPFIEKARAVVLQHIEDGDFSVDDLGAARYLSRSQLYRKLKAITDMSTTIFIRSVRLQEARKLLATTDLTIAEIAYRVGFKTPVYFSQVYTKAFGESPKTSRI